MNYALYALSIRYAKAYLNVFEQQLSLFEIDKIDNAAIFFKKQKKHLYFLSLITIPEDEKIKAIQTICDKLQLHSSIYTLITLLITHKRTELLADIYKQIAKIYYQRHNIIECTIKTAAPLEEADRTTVEQFITQKLNKKALCDYTIEHELIAGIKIVSDTHLWEQSVIKNIKNMRSALLPYSKG